MGTQHVCLPVTQSRWESQIRETWEHVILLSIMTRAIDCDYHQHLLKHIGTMFTVRVIRTFPTSATPEIDYGVLNIPITPHEEPKTPKIYNTLRQEIESNKPWSSPFDSYDFHCTRPQESTMQVYFQHKSNDRARLTVCLMPLSNACSLNFPLTEGQDHHLQLRGEAADC